MKKTVAILLVFMMILTGCDTIRTKGTEESVPSSTSSVTTPKEQFEEPVSNIEETMIPNTQVSESPYLIKDIEVDTAESTKASDIEETTEVASSNLDYDYEDPVFDSLDDDTFLRYIEDQYYADLEQTFGNEDYQIQEIHAIYLSKEYLEDVEYNSLENIYFGYKLSDVEQEFGNINYSFTLGENNETIVEELESYDYACEKMLKNVTIGAGVILVLVVVTIATDGADIPVLAAVSAISSSAAKGALISALSSGAIGAALGGSIEYYKSGDKDKALKAAGLMGSDGFKTGAIVGAIAGGIEGGVDFYNTSHAVPTWMESEKYIQSQYGGEEQLSYLNGELVSKSTSGATRPDLVRFLEDGTQEAIEIKNYNLQNPNNVNELCTVLKHQVEYRVDNLPEGMVQRIVLDVRNRGFSPECVNEAVTKIRNVLDPIYPDIPIDVVGLA